VTAQADLRARAQTLGQALPALLAQAQQLAATVIMGDHGRRRAGMGDAFWQFRPAAPGDSLRRIDWRRSARGDQTFVRENEWQAAQTVTIWADAARSMGFTGSDKRAPKADRAQLLALALAVLLIRGGERVGLPGLPARSGRGQVDRIAQSLLAPADADYGTPDVGDLALHGWAVFVSDFLGDIAALESALGRAADRGVTGALVQVLDPAEEEFPFDGRTIFESMGGSLRHETLRAGDLRLRYLDRLAERKARLTTLARASGWQYHCHHTGEGAQSALLWLFRAIEGGR
jgi:uncharacterized protein (DUF58 family)